MSVEGPDRGYSWIIVLCCAYIHFAIFGLFRSWGVLYVAVLKEYGVTREEASWPFSLCSAVFQLTGPAVSVITHYFSKRGTCLFGTTIATIGVVGCYFAENVMWITIFYGVIHGIGFGVVMTLIPVFLNQYFVKHRATAIGIAFSGGSVSSLIAPIVLEWLLDDFGLRGSFLILGGVIMNTLVASAMLRPPPWLKKSKRDASKLLEDSEAKDSGVSTSGDGTCEVTGQISLQIEQPQDSVFFDNTPERDDSNTGDASLEVDSASVSEKIGDTVASNDSILFGGSVSKEHGVIESSGSDKDNSNEKSELEAQTPLMNKNLKPVYIIPKTTSNFTIIPPARYSIVDILKNPIFYLISFTMFIFFIALQSFFVVIVDYAKDKGIPETDGVYLLSIFSITDLAGRSGLGWITDSNYVKRQHMVIFSLVAISMIMQLYPLINDLTGLLVVAAFHGICTGSCITLFFVLQADYLGVQRLTLVVGLTSFITGALTLVRPAMIGVFRDTIGSYDWMFHFLGMVSLAFAFIWIAESWMTRGKVGPSQNSNEKS